MKEYLLKYLLATFFVVAIQCNGFSQLEDIKRTVAVMPFSASCSGCEEQVTELQQLVSEVLVAKKGITSIDRTNDTLLNIELDQQQDASVINSLVLVEQGRKLGAQDIIIGRIISISGEIKTSVLGMLSKLDKSNLSSPSQEKVYTGKLTFSLTVTDVETGKIKGTNTFEFSAGLISSMLTEYKSVDEAIAGVVKDNKDGIKKFVDSWINKIYPPKFKLFSVVSRNKDGFPKTILITGGSDVNISVGAEISINEFEEIFIDDKKSILRRSIGVIKVKELQGDFTLCKVVKGEELLESLANANKLELVIKY